MAAILKTLSQKIKSAVNADLPCWYEYLHETADKK